MSVLSNITQLILKRTHKEKDVIENLRLMVGNMITELNLDKSKRLDWWQNNFNVLVCFVIKNLDRFKKLIEILGEDATKKFYKKIWAFSTQYGKMFVEIIMSYFLESRVTKRYGWMIPEEDRIIQCLPIKAVVN